MDIVALQIDLGRQKEHIDFLKSFVLNAKKWGYNTILLYLECSVRTSVTPFLDVDDTYSLAEIKELAEFIETNGMNAIPAFENFSHIEKLLQYDEAKVFSEFTDERTEGRGWMSERFKRGTVGCTSNPEFHAFFDKYITEVCSVFHGQYVHMGLDEVFEFGECPRCKALIKTGVTKKDMFFNQVMHCHELAKRIGKTMMMWDDFFEYYDIVADLPRDIIMCHWNYNFVGSETKGHWTNRVRKDWLAIYDRLGFNYIFCAYGSNASSTYNVDSLTAFASKYRPIGALLTIWERAASFYNGIYPLIALCGKMWNGEIKSYDDRLKVYTEVLGDEDAAALLLKNQVLTNCGISTDVANKAEDDNVIKNIYRGVLESLTENLHRILQTENKMTDEQRDILTDIYDFTFERYLIYKTNSLGQKIFDEYEKSNREKKSVFSQIYNALSEIEAGYAEINANCEYLWNKYRFGLKSSGGLMQNTAKSRCSSAGDIKRAIEKNCGCGVLYLDMVTPDGFGTPKLKIKIKYSGEEEQVVYFGAVKPEAVTFDLGGTSTIRFAIENKKIEYVVLESYGEDSLFVSNVRYLAGGEKYSVKTSRALCGKVVNEQNIIACNTTFAELGCSDCVAHLADVSLAKQPNAVELTFGLLD